MLKTTLYLTYVSFAVYASTGRLELGVLTGATALLAIAGCRTLERRKNIDTSMLMIFLTPLIFMMTVHIYDSNLYEFFPYAERVATKIYPNWVGLFNHLQATGQQYLAEKILAQLNAATLGVVLVFPLTIYLRVQESRMIEASSQILGGCVFISCLILYFLFAMEVYRPNCATKCINFSSGGLIFFVFFCLGWSLLLVMLKSIQILVKIERSKRA